MSDLSIPRQRLIDLCDEIVHNYGIEVTGDADVMAIRIIEHFKASNHRAEDSANVLALKVSRLEKQLQQGDGDKAALEESRRNFNALLAEMGRSMRGK